MKKLKFYDTIYAWTTEIDGVKHQLWSVINPVPAVVGKYQLVSDNWDHEIKQEDIMREEDS
jgi:hypothetical protein